MRGGGATEIIAQARAGLSQIATGSYVGTGTYGESEKNSLNFDFSPKLLVISSSESKKEFFAIINYYNGIGFNEKASDYYSYNNKYLRSQIANNSISWYEQYAAEYQGNLNGVVYNYIAFG